MDNLQNLEQKVLKLLQEYAIDDIAKYEIAPLVAKKSILMNHLYQDLGFESRVQMGKFMQQHFPNFAIQKPQDKLWKKFIYDTIGEVAPACSDCKDKINCFTCLVV